MRTYDITSEQSDLRVTFRPNVPGLSVRVKSLSGQVSGELDERGLIDWGAPMRAWFEADVGDLDFGNRFLTRIGQAWLGSDRELPIKGSLGEVAPHECGEHFDARVSFLMRGDTHQLATFGRISQAQAGALTLAGETNLHPRDVGVPVPRFGVPRVHVAWRIALTL